jgi:hypothetical protein
MPNRTARLELRTTTELRARIDGARGRLSRTAWIETAIEEKLARGPNGTPPAGDQPPPGAGPAQTGRGTGKPPARQRPSTAAAPAGGADRAARFRGAKRKT